MSILTFHIFGLPYIRTSREIYACPFTQKIYNLCDILKSNGHRVVFYGVEKSSVNCDVFIQVLSEKERSESYGNFNEDFEFYSSNSKSSANIKFNERCLKALLHESKYSDIVLLPYGNIHQYVIDNIPDYKKLIVIESGIGYDQLNYSMAIFDSYAWMHYLYGKNGVSQGRWHDAVIPNCFYQSDYEFNRVSNDYIMFLGRVVNDKGISTAIELAKRCNTKLIIAGKSSIDIPNDSNIEYVGCLDWDTKCKFLKNAKALIAPTYYFEPFGRMIVESLFCGTPVITTDWGAFSETVKHGKVGYRCRTMEEFVWSLRNISTIDRQDCHRYAVNNFSVDVIGQLYEEYFQRISRCASRNWYADNPQRLNLKNTAVNYQ